LIDCLIDCSGRDSSKRRVGVVQGEAVLPEAQNIYRYQTLLTSSRGPPAAQARSTAAPQPPRYSIR